MRLLQHDLQRVEVQRFSGILPHGKEHRGIIGIPVSPHMKIDRIDAHVRCLLKAPAHLRTKRFRILALQGFRIVHHRKPHGIGRIVLHTGGFLRRRRSGGSEVQLFQTLHPICQIVAELCIFRHSTSRVKRASAQQQHRYKDSSITRPHCSASFFHYPMRMPADLFQKQRTPHPHSGAQCPFQNELKL